MVHGHAERDVRPAVVAAQVRADHGVGRREQRRHPVPGRVGAGVPVQEQDRWAGPAVAHAQARLGQLDRLQGEAVEHRGRRPLGSI
jgi:hypothetical protein